MKRNLKVSSLPSLIPDTIEVDVSELDIGDLVKVGDVVLGEGIEILDPPAVGIVAVAVTKVTIEIEEEEAEELPEEESEESKEEYDEETTE
ncbi:unnamed protein product [marine sediment metagenome]|uniref:Large ribosomal subunit protein bL25 beta domain-containing protein n=1 Tax=marine sediment metagenome TaxID=412755 RepID=X1Q4E7_9ZZZZ